jgi:hypothetical protein
MSPPIRRSFNGANLSNIPEALRPGHKPLPQTPTAPNPGATRRQAQAPATLPPGPIPRRLKPGSESTGSTLRAPRNPFSALLGGGRALIGAARNAVNEFNEMHGHSGGNKTYGADAPWNGPTVQRHRVDSHRSDAPQTRPAPVMRQAGTKYDPYGVNEPHNGPEVDDVRIGRHRHDPNAQPATPAPVTSQSGAAYDPYEVNAPYNGPQAEQFRTGRHRRDPT